MMVMVMVMVMMMMMMMVMIDDDDDDDDGDDDDDDDEDGDNNYNDKVQGKFHFMIIWFTSDCVFLSSMTTLSCKTFSLGSGFTAAWAFRNPLHLQGIWLELLIRRPFSLSPKRQSENEKKELSENNNKIWAKNNKTRAE